MRKTVAVAVVAIAMFTSGIAVAATTSTKIHACKVKSTGAVRLVGARATCKDSEVKLYWNVTGPRGYRGYRGYRGETGAQGTQGEPGEKGDPGTPAPSYGVGTGLALSPENVFSVNDVPWGELTGLPPGFADGTDNVGSSTAADLDCNGCLTSADLAGSYGDAWTTPSVAGAVTGEKIADGAVEVRDLAQSTVTQFTVTKTLDERSVDPGEIAPHTRAAISIWSVDIAMGDMVTVSPPLSLSDDLLFVGSDVTPTGLVIYLYNNTAATIDDGPNTWQIEYLNLP